MSTRANGSRRRSAAPTIGLAAYDRKPSEKRLKDDCTTVHDAEQATAIERLARSALRSGLTTPGSIGFQTLALAAYYGRRHRILLGRSR